MIGKYTAKEITRILRIAMEAKKVTGAEIARGLGINRSSVNGVVIGTCKSRRVRKALAEQLDLEITDLWPDEGETP